MSGQSISQGAVAIAEAEAELLEARSAVDGELSALHHQLTATVSWRRWVRRHPTVSLALALGLGVALGHRLFASHLTATKEQP